MTAQHTERFEADEAGVRHAAAALRAGLLVAFPTETVYGLGADARSDEAVARIYAAKGRPRFNPLIAHVSQAEAAFAEGQFGPEARRLAESFWPGPLTLVVPASHGCSVGELARAGLSSVALRVPEHPVAQALLALVAVPVAAPSANRSGRISPTTADAVLAELDGRADIILDGGPTLVGLESTIVSCLDEPRLLRPGGVPRAEVEAVLGRQLAEPPNSLSDRPLAPGLLASHYAPEARVRLHAAAAEPDEAVLDFAGQVGATSGRAHLDLSPQGDLVEAAANLFRFLRRLDATGAVRIAVAPIPLRGLGEAINDRLSRAAAPRPWGSG